MFFLWRPLTLYSLTYNDDEADQLSVGSLSTLPSDNVPFLRRADDDLGSCYLLLVQLVVSSQLTHCHLVASQPLGGGEKDAKER